MGREIKRVAANFEWPLGERWKGFVNPHDDGEVTCTACEGSGYSPKAVYLKDQWYGNVDFAPEDRGSTPYSFTHPVIIKMATVHIQQSPEFYGRGDAAIEKEARRLCALFNSRWQHHINADDVAALIKNGRLMDFTHTWTNGEGWKPKEPAVIPTPQEVNEWSLIGFGHDSLNAYYCIGAECERLGVDSTCEKCKGEGRLVVNEAAKKIYDEWTDYEPPAGDWWQVWETVSEGSPITPAFPAAEALIKHLTTVGTSWDKHPWTVPEAENFVKAGWAMSGIFTPETGFMTGVQHLGVEKEDQS